jgi:hypothetical protein
MSQKRREPRRKAQHIRDQDLDRKVSIIARHIDELEKAGAQVYLVMSLETVQEIGRWAARAAAQARDN